MNTELTPMLYEDLKAIAADKIVFITRYTTFQEMGLIDENRKLTAAGLAAIAKDAPAPLSEIDILRDELKRIKEAAALVIADCKKANVKLDSLNVLKSALK